MKATAANAQDETPTDKRPMKKTLIALLFTLPAPLAHADPVWAVRPEPGLVCMATSTPAPQILDVPSAKGRPLAVAGPIVLARHPSHLDNGYVEVERPNKQTGWVLQGALSPGPAKCVPTLMSNGLILIGGAG